MVVGEDVGVVVGVGVGVVVVQPKTPNSRPEITNMLITTHIVFLILNYLLSLLFNNEPLWNAPR